jgi:hypothetical protein
MIKKYNKIFISKLHFTINQMILKIDYIKIDYIKIDYIKIDYIKIDYIKIDYIKIASYIENIKVA